jgi:hypothetical protein
MIIPDINPGIRLDVAPAVALQCAVLFIKNKRAAAHKIQDHARAPNADQRVTGAGSTQLATQ